MMAARSIDPAPVHEEGLLDGCRRGDRAALERVLGVEAPGLERLLRRLLGPGAHVEDVLQDTLEGAILSFPSYRGEAAVSAWMMRIAVRTAFRFLRRQEARGEPMAIAIDEAADRSATQETLVASRRALAATYGHLARLSAKKRIAFMLHVFEGRPIADVAALMGATEMATKSRIFFARRELMARARRDPELADRAADLDAPAGDAKASGKGARR
jgi:RNA polymerase sigma-70 factor (ECF subfamily)